MTKTRQPLIIAHHLMWTLYGWWLPNDPRGSTSSVIRSDFLKDLGELHNGRKRIQPAGKDIHEFYNQAASALKYPLMEYGINEFPTVAAAIGDAIRGCNYTCYACAIMPDHLHLVIRKHRDLAEQMIEKIQALSRERLWELGLRAIGHPTWTRGGWKVFLDHPDEVRRTIRYVEDNPRKMRLPPQQWPFVQIYNGWPLHPGHSLNSPYVKALRAAGREPR